ncbi:MAG: protoporphyrinogen oxidase [Candidatus Melainabacteria bacterium]|nr:protoporphyrinogen oxidase [Candidatus Melainabacteria bacterium]
MKIVIVGSGISGLAAAFSILKSDSTADLSLLEADLRSGGIISTRLEGGCVIEEGPDSFLTTKPWALELCQMLNLENQILQTNEANRRALIAIDGQLQPLPEGFMLLAPTKIYPFLDSKILSAGGKLMGVLEVFRPSIQGDVDETLKSFAVRRFGQEMFDRIVQPMVGGIYTGDPEKLSAQATVPQFVEMEQKHGSVGKAILNNSLVKSSDSGARYSAFVTLKSGLQTLTNALVDSIGRDKIYLGCRVQALSQVGRSWRLHTNDGRDFDADIVVLATPARASSVILQTIDPQLSADLAAVEYGSSVVLNMLFDAGDIGHPMDGFGFVVPELERKSIIACSFSSTKFKGRAPQNKVLMRVFLGGVLHPDVFAFSDGELVQSALKDLRTYLKITSYPQEIWIKRWPNSMPQYNVGHLQSVKRMKEHFSKHDRLIWAGSALSGVGIPDCVRAGFEAAQRVHEFTRAPKDPFAVV